MPRRSSTVTSLLVTALAGLTILCAPRAAGAQTRLTLEQVITRSLAGPRAGMARADRAAAEARVAEADAARLPRLSATGFVTASPDIDCVGADCTRTDPDDFALRFSGVFAGGQVQATQPLYTFGKLGAARAAARAGVDAQRALEDATAGDLAVDAARAYWGLKLARELGYMLDDGIDEVTKALARLDERLEAGDDEVTILDRQRVEVLLAEGKVQRAEATGGERAALAALRALTGVADVDIDDGELAALPLELGDEAGALARAQAGNPQARAAAAGARAAEQLVALERGAYWPDLALVGQLQISRAQGAEEPPSAYAYDPFNSTTGGLVLALRWQIEPWTTRARVRRADAGAARAAELSALARTGASYEAQVARAEADSARARIDAATTGEAAARSWMAAVLQADAVGTAEAKDLADAYLAWFQMRARLLTAIYQWNVAVAKVARAAGQLPTTTR